MIQDKAMLVSLKLSVWNPRKYDKDVTSEVNNHYQARDAGRFNKILIDLSEM